MNAEYLHRQILEKRSCLCIGLDTSLDLIPEFLREQEFPLFEFNKGIVDATSDLAIAYKPNLAFYERHGSEGWIQLEMTCRYIREEHPGIMLIADGKRGDIANTSAMYADAVFDRLGCDALTLSPYMGRDSVGPFYRDGKWVVVLALTSNEGSADFQLLPVGEGDSLLYEQVLKIVAGWGNTDNTMFVVGATKAEYLRRVRLVVPDHFLLVPGIGTQGGSLEEVMEGGLNEKGGLIINVSRKVLYAGQGRQYAASARSAAVAFRNECRRHLENLLRTR